MPDVAFVQAKRVMSGVSVPVERRVLEWMAKRLPAAIGADHLTALGLMAMVGAGVCYWLSAGNRPALGGVVICLALNWVGDSLDGTVARVRNQQRPRYGFYVDHVLDMFGTLFLVGGMALSGLMSPVVGLLLLIAYLMLLTEVYLATYCVASFRLAFFHVGPTELRIVLAIGTAVAAFKPRVGLLGGQYQLFDVGAVVAIAGILAALLVGTVQHIVELYRAEPLPGKRRPGSTGGEGVR